MLKKFKNLCHFIEAIIAAIYYRFPSRKLIVIGVTGTDGKTTTVNLIHHILIKAGYKAAVVSTLSSAHTTTPGPWKLQKFLAQSVEKGCTHVVLEVSSHAIDQHRIWGINFEIGVLTNIAQHEHLDYHKTFDNYRKTKMSFLATCHKTISKEDWPHDFTFETNLIGKFNRENILTAVATVFALGIDKNKVRLAIKSFKSPLGRMEIVIRKPFIVIIDYAHTPQAFEKVLPEVKKMGRKLVHVFGATGDRDKSKRPIMAQISAKYADKIILTSEDSYFEDQKEIISQLEAGLLAINFQNYGKLLDRRSAIEAALLEAQKGDVVMITGIGHQRSINVKGEEKVWNEPKIVKEIIKEIGKKTK